MSFNGFSQHLNLLSYDGHQLWTVQTETRKKHFCLCTELTDHSIAL